MLNLDTDKAIIALYESADVGVELSDNATRNIQEFIADTWAEARTSKKPRALASKIDSIIKDILGNYDG